jgi:hypothetical protein
VFSYKTFLIQIVDLGIYSGSVKRTTVHHIIRYYDKTGNVSMRYAYHSKGIKLQSQIHQILEAMKENISNVHEYKFTTKWRTTFDSILNKLERCDGWINRQTGIPEQSTDQMETLLQCLPLEVGCLTLK